MQLAFTVPVLYQFAIRIYMNLFVIFVFIYVIFLQAVEATMITSPAREPVVPPTLVAVSTVWRLTESHNCAVCVYR